MPSRSELDLLYQIGSQLAPAIHQAQNWPYDVPHAQYEASLWPPHDVGGQPDAPVRYEEKEEEQWELDTYVTCEVLAWKGVECRGTAPSRQQRYRSVALLRLPLLRTLGPVRRKNAGR